MKVLIVLCVVGYALAAPEAPAAPYAPSGWRPKGPAFELPTRTENKPTQEYGPPKQAVDVEVTEEELQYTGETVGTTEGTTPFLEYGAPATELPEFTTTVSDVEDDLSVQGLPGTEPAKQFRNLPENDISQRFRNQRVRVQPRPQNGRIQQQFFQGSQFQQQQQRFQQRQFTSIGGNLVAPTQNQQFAPQQQFAQQRFGNFANLQQAPVQFNRGFAQFAAPAQIVRSRQPNAFNQRFVSQRQEQGLDSYGAPAQEYGPPSQAYGPPQPQPQPPQEVEDVDQPEQPQEEPEQIEEDTTEGSVEPEADVDDEGNVAVSNAVATGRYVLLPSGRAQKLRAGSRVPTSGKLRLANVMQINEPIYTYNQFGQLVRIF